MKRRVEMESRARCRELSQEERCMITFVSVYFKNYIFKALSSATPQSTCSNSHVLTFHFSPDKGLKKHWDEVFRDFTCLPLFASNPRIVRRKTELEGILKELERDIKMFTRTGPLFVADVAQSHYI